MTRHDGFFFWLGPFAILLIWLLLPWGRSEAWRAGDRAPASAVAELVGYAFEASPQTAKLASAARDDENLTHMSRSRRREMSRKADGTPARQPVLLGRGAEADFRLHSAPVAPRAAWLTPPQAGRDAWTILPAGPGLTLRLLEKPANPGSAGQPPETRVVNTSVRPWRGRTSGLSRLMPWRRPATEPVAIDCGTPNGAVTLTPAQLDAAGALAGTWGARVDAGGEERTVLPWSESSGDGDLWLRVSGPKPRWIEVGIAADDPPISRDLPKCSISTPPGQRTPRRSDTPAGAPQPLPAFGALELRDGDLLAIGRTRFLVRTGSPSKRSHRLELYHVRDPEAPGYFRASAGHDAYHPNRRALWNVPPCGATAGAPQETLTLVVEPPKTLSGVTASAAELPSSDRRRQREIADAVRDHGLPHELPAVMPDRAGERALLSLCTTGTDRGIGVRLVATGVGLRRQLDGDAEQLTAERTLPIGGRSGDPRELLVDLDGNLLNIAPAAGPRITRRTRAGLAAFLIFVLALQAWPLTRARIRYRQQAKRAQSGSDPWPAALVTPSLQQVAGIAIVSLLFLGASFHLMIGLHPELVGKPDYLQAFLQGTVAVCVILAAAAGFSYGSGLEQRCASAALAAAATLLAAALWWWLDAAGRPQGAWLTAWRDRASAAAGAGPQAMGRRMLLAGGLGAAAAAVLFLSVRLRWSRAAEGLGRFAVRVPLAGFVVLALAGLVLGLLQRSALAFELALLAGLAWYAAAYWAFVRHGRQIREDALRRKAAATSMASGLLMLLFLAVFFIVGADLPDAVSFVSVTVGLGILAAALRLARGDKSTSLLRVVSLWVPATILGMGFASFVLTDMGSVAAWVPALLTGFFLWLVRPEEIDNRREEPRKALSHLLLALGSGLVLLGLLDVFKRVVEGLDWRLLERPQQRLALAEDISYITSGEWITQVRWLASRQDDTLHWVPNANSDVAIFGLAANLGSGWAIVASLWLLAIAGCAALAADQALRQARARVLEGTGDRLVPALYRTLGLALGMICVLLIAQWLVHLATGVVLHLPITGLVFPWISHGNTTHLLYAAAILLPMAAITALTGEGRGHR